MSAPGYEAEWPALSGVRTWQTTRQGGVSRGAYATLNLATHVGDEPDAVAANRGRLRDVLELPGEPIWLEQVHGSRVLAVDQGETGQADGAVTSRAGRVLAVMTADCLPVLLASQDGEAIGIAHAGWRGLAGGVLESAVAALGRDPAEIQVWLGPAIGQRAFEVGDEVRAAFVERDPAAADAFRGNARRRWQADLYRLARQALQRAGVSSIFGDEACTYSDQRYFSHRREAPCGRMASLIWRTK